MKNLDILENQLIITIKYISDIKKDIFDDFTGYFDVDPSWMILSWLYRKCSQFGECGKWSYFFHGYDCELESQDGMTIFLDFGSLGTEKSFSEWSLARFVASRGFNRFAFPDLRNIVRNELPNDQVRIQCSPITVICDRLLHLGYLERWPGIRSIEDIPKSIVAKYSLTQDSFLFSIISRTCLTITSKGIEQAMESIDMIDM